MNKLHVAAMAGDLQGVRDAITSGIDVDSVESAHGNTALMLAAYNNRPSVIAWLIGSGANIDARCKQENTALMKAAWSGATECVAALLRAGADVNAVDRGGMTPLMIAAFHGHSDAVKFLVEAVLTPTGQIEMDTRRFETLASAAMTQSRVSLNTQYRRHRNFPPATNCLNRR